MAGYVATINVPGYMPMDDDPPVFETAQEAWEWLTAERMESEDHAYAAAGVLASYGEECEGEAYSETVEELSSNAILAQETGFTEGTVYGPTPGYDGNHDLGLAYCVTYTDETPEEV